MFPPACQIPFARGLRGLRLPSLCLSYLEIWNWGEGSHFGKETVESRGMTTALPLSTASALEERRFL